MRISGWVWGSEWETRPAATVIGSVVMLAGITAGWGGVQAGPATAERADDTHAEEPAAELAEKPAEAPDEKPDEKPAEEKAKKEKKRLKAIAVVTVAGSLPEGASGSGLLGDVSPRLHRLVERLDRAAEDRRVGGVLLVVESPDIGRGRAAELRAAIQRVRERRKPVAALLVGSQPIHYSLAAACDRVVMPPASTLELTGVRAEVTFFKEMLDKLSVEAEILQVGDFKGAGEPLTRSSMSPQLRQQYEAFVGDLFDQLVERVAEDRSLDEERVRQLIDQGIFTPPAALDAGLIDAVAYEDDVIAWLDQKIDPLRKDDDDSDDDDAKTPKILRDYGLRKADVDFSGIGGLVKLMEVFGGGGESSSSGSKKKVAVIHITGAIRQGNGGEGLLAEAAAGSSRIIKAIREAGEDDSVAAVVLRIDSPGGSALASDMIWREVKRLEKPVVASLSDTAASGGYYIAVAADRIVAAAGSLTGSIGVVGGKVAVGDALAKIGVRTDVVSRGRNAGWLSSNRPFTDSERAAFLDTMQDVYRLFTGKVAEGRKLPREQIEQLAEGRVFTGRMAAKAGLVDRLGTLEDAVDEACELAELDDEPERLLLPKPRGLFEDLLGGEPGGGAPLGRLPESLLGPFARLVPEAAALVELSAGQPMLLLPARVRVR